MRQNFLLLLLALLAATRAEGNDACQADFDGNGIVDFADFMLFNGLYGQSGGETCAMTVDADSLAVVTALRDSISALQAALGATRFAVATLQSTTTELQNALASETERANENKRLLTASNDAFNSLAQTRCPESEPAAQPEPPAPATEPEPPVVIEPQPATEPPPPPRFKTASSHFAGGQVSFNKEIRADGDGWIVDIKVSAGFPDSIHSVWVEDIVGASEILQRRLKTGVDTWRDPGPSAWVQFSPPIQLDGPFFQIQYRPVLGGDFWSRYQHCLHFDVADRSYIVGTFFECFIITE